MTTPAAVTRTYLIIAGIYTLSASLIWGVNTLFLMSVGLNIAEVFIANAAFTAGMVIFEVPTGVLADTAGRRASFLLSALVLAASTFAYVAAGRLGGGVIAFSIVSVFLGLGFTFYSGAVEAWLVDALRATGFTGALDGVFARGGAVAGGAMLLGSVGGGLLGTIDLAIPFVLRGILLISVFGIAFFLMRDLGFTPRALRWQQIPQEMRRVAAASITYGWNVPDIRLIMIAGLIQGAFGLWGFYAWQPHFLALFGDPGAVYLSGFITALISLTGIIGSLLVGRVLRLTGQRTPILIGTSLVFALCMVGVGQTTNFYLAVGLFLLAMLANGLAAPVRQSFIHQLTPTEQRATVISVDSLFANAGGIGGQIALGQIALTLGIAPGYVIGGLFTGLVLPVLVRLRARHSPADPAPQVQPTGD